MVWCVGEEPELRWWYSEERATSFNYDAMSDAKEKRRKGCPDVLPVTWATEQWDPYPVDGIHHQWTLLSGSGVRVGTDHDVRDRRENHGEKRRWLDGVYLKQILQ